VRRLVSRFLLVALAVAAGVAVWRFAGGSRGGAVVALDGLRAESLAHQAFRLDAPARLALDAAGSFEERPDTALAAFGWIVRRADGALVWRQRPGVHPPRGLVSAVRDTVRLDAGVYDAYFASYGDPVVRAAAAPAAPPSGLRERIREALSRGGRAWQGESGRWHFRATGATAADRDLAVALDDEPAPVDDAETVWAEQALGSGRRESALIRVSAPVTVRVEAVLEAAGDVVADSAAIVRVGAPADTVWAFAARGTVPAGGSVKNRRVDARVRLTPGLYRATVHTDGVHAAGDWTATPPWAPWTWGVRISRTGAPASAVGLVDTEAIAAEVRAGTSRLPVLAEARCVGTSRTVDVGFVLSATVDALVVAQGEITSDGAYDYATLVRGAAGAGETVWTMTRDESESAGGDSRNRRVAHLLALAPGAYTLRYQTDGSHDCEDGYSSGSDPDDEGFWGATVVALDPALDPATIQRLAPISTGVSTGDEDEPVYGDEGPNSQLGVTVARGGEEILAFERVGNDARLERAFTLDAATRIRIVAAGELLPSAALDTGWIENAQGERVWELTRANSVPAGGQPKNRRFDGVLTLAPGRYTAHYVTDDRHAYGAFDGPAPDDAEWGLRIERLADE
jgi:hypothetical protein